MSRKGFEDEKEVAKLFGLSGPDLSNRKKRGSLLPFIVDWAINENVNLDWLIRGESDTPEKKASPVLSKIDLMLEGMDEEAQRDVLKYTEEKKLLAECLKERALKKAA